MNWASECLSQTLTNMQTKSDALFVDAFVLLVNLPELFEDSMFVQIADSDSRVSDLELDCVLIAIGLTVDHDNQVRVL